MQTADNKEYAVRKVTTDGGPTVASGSPLWKSAGELSTFTYPWEPHQPHATMTFKAMHDGHWLYWQFRVDDRNVQVYVDKNQKTEVVYGDRVEMFFTSDDALSRYYCLEIDPLGRVYDYSAIYYRRFDSGWQWPAGQLHVKPEQDGTGYTITGSIGLPSLKSLGLIEGDRIRCGLYRGKCLEINLVSESMAWISWVTPASATPDFHIPSSFGVLRLEKI